MAVLQLFYQVRHSSWGDAGFLLRTRRERKETGNEGEKRENTGFSGTYFISAMA